AVRDRPSSGCGRYNYIPTVTRSVWKTPPGAVALVEVSYAELVQSPLWYVDHEGRIGPLDLAKTRNHRAKDPETFRARLTIVAEGATEWGFGTALLEKAVGALEEGRRPGDRAVRLRPRRSTPPTEAGACHVRRSSRSLVLDDPAEDVVEAGAPLVGGAPP